MATATIARESVAASPQAPARPPVNKWLVTFAVTVGTLMGALDTSIVNVAIPYIRGNLGVTITEVTWISTGYLIALVIIMPLTAWLGLTFGRKRVYISCLLLFITASFFCGTARTLTELIVFRVLQGIGAGALQPTEQAILRETFPVEEQAMAMSLYGLAVMIGPALGPTLGGWITDNYNWPWIFFINIPIGIAGVFMVNRFVHDPPHVTAQRGKAGVDGVGITLLAVGLGALQTVLEEGETNDWFSSNLIIGLAVLATVSLCTFVWWELRQEKPAVDLSILRNMSFSTGTFIGGILGIGLYASMFLLPLFMQDLLGYTATLSGLVLMPRSLVMLVCMPIAGMLYNRTGPKLMIGSGLVIAGLAPIMLSHITLDTSAYDLIVPQMIQGFGFVLIFVALSTTAMAGVDRTKLTNATGLYNLIRQLGGSFGTALFATLIQRGQQGNHVYLGGHINSYSPAFGAWNGAMRQMFAAHGADLVRAQQQALAVANNVINQQAAVLSYDTSFYLIGWLFYICVPLVFLLKSAPRKGHAEPVEM